MKRFISSITILLLLAMNFSFMLPAQAASPTLSLSPAAKNLTIGQTFDVQVLVNTGGQDTDAADAILYYEPQYLEVVDMMPTIPGVQSQQGSIYQVYPGNDVDATSGRIRLTAFSIMSPFNSGAGTGVLATIRFKALASTPGTPVLFDFVPGGGSGAYVPGSSQDSNIVQTDTSDDILASVTGGMYVIGPDTVAPYVINFNPSNGATGVSPSTNITFTVVDDLTDIDIASLQVVVKGVTYTATGANRFTYAGSGKRIDVTIDPATNFNYLDSVITNISGADKAGNAFTYTSQFTVGAQPVNLPPVLGPLPDRIVAAGDTLTMLVTATDPNAGDQLTITMTGAPAGMTSQVVGNGRVLVTWTTTTADLAAKPVITFTVRDNGSPVLSDTDSMTVSVVEPEVPVVVEPPPEEDKPPVECPVCSACGQRTACEDNRDNDGDGNADWPEDPQCVDRRDNDEVAITNTGALLQKLSVDVGTSLRMAAATVTSSMYTAASATGTAALRVSPSTGTFYPGQIVNVSVLVETGSMATNAVDLVMTYEPANFEIIDAIPATAGVQIQPGTIYEAYPGNVVNTTTGEIKLTAFSVIGTYNSGTGSGVVATVPMKALQVSSGTPLNILFTPGVTTDSNVAFVDTGDDLLTAVVSGNYVIAPETNPPTLTNFLPANNTLNRTPGQGISFRLQDAETGVALSSVHVTINGTDYTASSAGIFSSSGTASSYLITLDPPNFAYGQVVTVVVNAQDTQGNSMSPYTSTFTIMAEPTNAAPVLSAISNKTITPGTTVSFMVNATDADTNDVLTYAVTSAPAGMTITKVTNTSALVEWTSPSTATGSYYPNISVTDSGAPQLSDAQIVTLGVAVTTPPPVVEPTPEPEAPPVCPPCPVCPECLDGVDNDGDGIADYPAEPGCLSPEDTTELDEVIPPICSDQKDNDNDGIFDYPYDPGCDSASDTDELDPILLPACSDRQDNDGDGFADFPTDPGCLSAADTDEVDIPEILPVAGCQDGKDNDGDGLVDYPQDPGCTSLEDTDEADGLPVIAKDIEEILRGLPAFLQSKPVQDVNTPVLGAIVVSLALANALASGLPLLLFLWYLFTEPVRALFGGRRKPWGIVYNSLTKMPTDLAIVRLYDAEDNSLLQTRVTNTKGEFYLNVDPGRYYISVAHAGYVFPTHYLAGKVEDGDYASVYHGGEFVVQENERHFEMSIPLDPEVKVPAQAGKHWKVTVRRLQYSMSFLGVAMAVVMFLITPNRVFGGFLAVHVVLAYLFGRLASPEKPKSWGRILDDRGRGVSRAIVRIFDKQYNKLLESEVTGRSGRFGFLVGRNVFYYTVTKPGYMTYRSEFIDLTKAESTSVIAHNVTLRKLSGGPGQPPVVPFNQPPTAPPVFTEPAVPAGSSLGGTQVTK